MKNDLNLNFQCLSVFEAEFISFTMSMSVTSSLLYLFVLQSENEKKENTIKTNN